MFAWPRTVVSAWLACEIWVTTSVAAGAAGAGVVTIFATGAAVDIAGVGVTVTAGAADTGTTGGAGTGVLVAGVVVAVCVEEVVAVPVAVVDEPVELESVVEEESVTLCADEPVCAVATFTLASESLIAFSTTERTPLAP